MLYSTDGGWSDGDHDGKFKESGLLLLQLLVLTVARFCF